MIWLMIILVIVAIFAGCGYLGYRQVSQKVRSLSKAAFGTDSFIEGYNRQADELALRPKSVNGMTKLMEPQIARDFPGFQWESFKQKAQNMLISAFAAIDQGDLSLLREASPALKEQVLGEIQSNEASRTRAVYQDVRIHQTEIANYVKKNGTCVITIQSAVEYKFYKECQGKVIAGDRERKTQTRYNVELAYIQDSGRYVSDTAVGVTCPNCGAPITSLSHMVCEYCGAEVLPVNDKIWTLQSFCEADYHHI